MNHAHLYCKTLDTVPRETLVDALHQALMQFYAIRKHETLTLVDNGPVIIDLERTLRKAGHIGFADDAEPLPPEAESHRTYHIQH